MPSIPPDARQARGAVVKFGAILVVTDRDDLAEVDVRHRSARERRFLDRLRSIAIELLFPTWPTTFEPEAADDIEIQTENAIRHAIDLIVLNDRDTGGWRSRFRRGLVGTLASRGSVPVYAVPRAESGHPD